MMLVALSCGAAGGSSSSKCHLSSLKIPATGTVENCCEALEQTGGSLATQLQWGCVFRLNKASLTTAHSHAPGRS